VEDPPRHLEHEHARSQVTAEAFSRPRARARLVAVGLVLVGVMGMAAEAPAQAPPPNYLEFRVAHSDGGVYRYVEYTRFLRSGPVVDTLYLGVPGRNELYVFQSAGEWSTLAGPLVVRNDGRGAWRASLRGGSTFEVRLTRTLAF